MALRDSRAFYLVGRFFRLGPAGEPADVYTNAGDFGFTRPIRVSDMSLADLFFASGSRGIVTKRDGTHNLKIETIRRPAIPSRQRMRVRDTPLPDAEQGDGSRIACEPAPLPQSIERT